MAEKAPSSKLEGTGKQSLKPVLAKGPVPASLLAGASLPTGWNRDETTGELRRDTIHSMLRRRKGWNYKGLGWYMVTLTLADRSRGWLGELVVGEAPSSKLEGTGGNGTGGKGTGGKGTVGKGTGGKGTGGKGIGGSDGSAVASARELARECFPSGGEGGGSSAFADLPSPEDCRIDRTLLGEIVAAAWREINDNWPGVEALDLQVMPEHLHGIIHVVTPQQHPLGQIVGSFKARVMAKVKAALGQGSGAAQALASKLASTGAGVGEALASTGAGVGEALASTGAGVGEALASKLASTGAGVGEALASKLASTGAGVGAGAFGLVPASLLAGASLWSPGLQDSILWTPLRRARATHYLRTNPYRLAIKRRFPWLFQVTRDLDVDFGDGLVGRFSAIGNQFLLEFPEMVQVQCSRSFFRYRKDARGNLLKDEPPEIETDEFREKWALASKLASTGAVLVSPCISQGEREIAKRAFRAGYRVITLSNKGFSPLYKPGGRLFEHCAAGNLLMLAPCEWPYQPGEKKMTRVDALVLNEIAGWLVERDGEAPSSKLEGTGVGMAVGGELVGGELVGGELVGGELVGGESVGARELARGCSPSASISYRGARVENVAQLAAAAVALFKTNAI